MSCRVYHVRGQGLHEAEPVHGTQQAGRRSKILQITGACDMELVLSARYSGLIGIYY